MTEPSTLLGQLKGNIEICLKARLKVFHKSNEQRLLPRTGASYLEFVDDQEEHGEGKYATKDAHRKGPKHFLADVWDDHFAAQHREGSHYTTSTKHKENEMDNSPKKSTKLKVEKSNAGKAALTVIAFTLHGARAGGA